MIELDAYLRELISECRSAFGGRLKYVGLQGSYLRGDANEDSDVDVMVILDGFSAEDMDLYRGGLSAEAYDKRPLRRLVRVSAGRVKGGRDQLREIQPRGALSRVVPPVYPYRP